MRGCVGGGNGRGDGGEGVGGAKERDGWNISHGCDIP